MESLLTSGRIVDLILILIAIEAVVVVLVARRRGSPRAIAGLLVNLVAGAALLLALRCVLVGSPWQLTASCLALSGLAHGFDLFSRLRSAPRAGLH